MDDRIEIFFTVEPIVDAILDRKDLPEPIVKFVPSRTCKTVRKVLFVKVTKNRKEKSLWN